MQRDTIQELEAEAYLEQVAYTTAAAGVAAPAPLGSWLLGFAILLTLLGLNHVAFTGLFETSHWRWYLSHGALIGFVTSVVATAWGDVNRNAELIAPHPLRYLRACAMLVGLPLFALGTHLRRGDTTTPARSPLDLLLSVPLVLLICVILLIWAVVVVPLQYFIYLLAGAPARLYAQSAWRPVARLRPGGGLVVAEAPKADGPPRGWWDASLFASPVTMTALLSAMLLFVLSPWLR
ncbi:MAG: hypothetical protein R6X06_02755 [Gammaproteobacteria bacterium]